MNIFELIGWMGVVLFVIAYLLLSLEKLSAERRTYHFMNMLGGLALVINAVHISDHPTIVVNGIWGLIALGALLKIQWSK